MDRASKAERSIIMVEGRYALIIACSEYQDTNLKELLKPGKDARALNAVLSHPNIGNFEVKLSINKEAHIVNQEIETFLNERKSTDIILLYFSCHGIKDEDGQLFFASTNTRLGLLGSTATSANFVNNAMIRSRSKSQILLLDCCYSGAFSKGMVAKSDERAITPDQFQGKGRIILTASDSMQYSFEGNELSERWENAFSFFTGSIIYGLQTGEADKDNDGKISSNELYDYVFDKVTDRIRTQRPQKWSFLEGDIIIAKNPHNTLGPLLVDNSPVKKPEKKSSPLDSTPLKRKTFGYVKKIVQSRRITLSLVVITAVILSVGFFYLFPLFNHTAPNDPLTITSDTPLFTSVPSNNTAPNDPYVAIVNIKIDDNLVTSDEIIKKISEIPQAKNVKDLYGQYDIFVEIQGESPQELSDVITNDIRTIKGITFTETLVVE